MKTTRINLRRALGALSIGAAVCWTPTLVRAGHLSSLTHGDIELFTDFVSGGRTPQAVIGLQSSRGFNLAALDRAAMRQFIYAWGWAKLGVGRTQTWRHVGTSGGCGIDSCSEVTVSTGPRIRIDISTVIGPDPEPKMTFEFNPSEVTRFNAAVETLGSRLSLLPATRH